MKHPASAADPGRLVQRAPELELARSALLECELVASRRRVAAPRAQSLEGTAKLVAWLGSADVGHWTGGASLRHVPARVDKFAS